MQQKLSDIIKDSIVVVTDDVNSISGDWVAAQFQADDIAEGLTPIETPREAASEHFIVDRDTVSELVRQLGETSLYVTMRRKEKQFMRDHSLTREDLKNIVRQLSVGDYTYSMESINELYLGHILTVFITGKDFTTTDGRVLENLVLYIKVDDTDEGVITIVGIHESEHPEEESHPYAEEFKEYENLWNNN